MSRTVFWGTWFSALLTILFGSIWIGLLKTSFITDQNVEGYAFFFAGIFTMVGITYNLYEKANNKLKPIHYLASPPGNLLSGAIPRTDEFRTLHRTLLPSRKPVTVYAVGGLGKTTLLQMYCKQYDNKYDRVVWLSASAVYSNDVARQKQNEEDFLRAFTENKALIDNLAITFDDKETAEERFQKIVNCLVNLPGRNLLVIDNVADVATNHFELLSHLKEWRILLTSRDAIPNTESFRLGTLTPQQAARLYCNIYGKSSTDPHIDEILEYIDYHTLTIELLAAYAREKKLDPPALLELLRQKGLTQLNDYEVNAPRSAKTQDIAAHLRDVFLMELDEAEQEILRNCCILPTSNVQLDPDLVSEDALCSLFGKKDEEIDFKNRLHRLARMNWLVESGGGYRCHPVVAETAKAQLKPDAVKCGVLIENVTGMLIPDKATNEPRIKRAPFGSLGEAVFKGLWKEKEDFTETDLRMANLSLHLDILFSSNGELYKALEHSNKALSIQEKVLPKDHPDLAISYNNLAGTYIYLGEYWKCLEYLEKTLSIQEKVLPKDHPGLATSYNNLAETYRFLGEYQKSLEYNLKDIAICERVLPSDHPDLATSYNNLALTYGALGEHQKQLEYNEKALSIWEKVLPSDHPDLATSYNNLAVTYGALNEHRRRLEYHEKALLIREKVLPVDHPDLAGSYNNIAWTYHDLGDIKQAVDYMQKAVAIREKSLPASHPDTALSKKSLVTLVQKLKNT